MPNRNQIIKPAKESEHYTASELRRVIGQLGFALTYPRGVSMRPLIWEDDHYLVISRLDGKPDIGDILLFEHIRQEKTVYIIHRLVDIEDADGSTVYVMRGDNCISCERITEDDIIGKVTEVYRNGNSKLRHAVRKKHFTMDDKSYCRYAKFWRKSWKVRKRIYGLISLWHRIKRRMT